MADKLTFEQVLDWVEGRLSAAEAADVAAQVAEDPAQMETAQWLRAFIRRSSSSGLVAPPERARSSVFKMIAARRKPQHSALQRVVAALLPASGPRLAGVRGSQRASQRQLTFTAEHADIVVNIQPRARDKQSDIQGQVLPTGNMDAHRLVVQMLRSGAEFGITMTNKLGEFAFESIPPGSYELIVSSDLAEIELAPITLSD